MSKFTFIIRFLIKKNKNKSNWNLLLPFFGSIIGFIAVALTLAIMEGMEYSIFTKLKNISFPAKLTNVSITDIEKIKEHLNFSNITSQKSLEYQVLIANNNNFRLVNLKAIEYLKNFCDSVLKIDFISNKIHKKEGLYIGRSLAIKLNLSIGDNIIMINPNKINILTGLPIEKNINIAGIYDFDLIDYEHNFIFSSMETIDSFISTNKFDILLNNSLDEKQLLEIKTTFPQLNYLSWTNHYSTFISAMKLEKFIYSSIGLIIIIISCFTLMTMMSLSVMQKIPQIGLLKSLGMPNFDIKSIFIVQAIYTSLLSSIASIIISYFIIYLDNNYHIINSFFPNIINFTFPLILKLEHIIIISLFSLFFMISSGLIPAYKASKIDPIKSINFF